MFSAIWCQIATTTIKLIVFTQFVLICACGMLTSSFDTRYRFLVRADLLKVKTRKQKKKHSVSIKSRRLPFASTLHIHFDIIANCSRKSCYLHQCDIYMAHYPFIAVVHRKISLLLWILSMRFAQWQCYLNKVLKSTQNR